MSELSVIPDIIGGVVVAAFAIFLPIVLLAFAIFIIGVSNRSDPDPRGARPIAAYSYSAAFLFLWVTVALVVAAIDSLINLIGNHAFGSNVHNEAARLCVIGAIALLVAGGGYLLHLRRGTALADAEDDPTGPTKRVMRSFVAFVCFVAALAFVFSLMVAIYEVFQLIDPSVFGGTTYRLGELRDILEVLVITVVTGLVFWYHQRFAPEALRLFGARGSGPKLAPPAAGPPTAG